MRTFISINIDDNIKNVISGIQDNLKDKISGIDKNFLKAIKWESKEKFHLTLFFIGDVDEKKLKEIDDKLSRSAAEYSLSEIKFELKRINAFPKLRYPRVLFIELSNEDGKVFKLSRMINLSLKQIGIESDKTFHPHITLGRVRRDHKINLAGLEPEFTAGSVFSVSEFFLMESKLKSTGSEYSIIKKYNI